MAEWSESFSHRWYAIRSDLRAVHGVGNLSEGELDHLTNEVYALVYGTRDDEHS